MPPGLRIHRIVYCAALKASNDCTNVVLIGPLLACWVHLWWHKEASLTPRRKRWSRHVQNKNDTRVQLTRFKFMSSTYQNSFTGFMHFSRVFALASSGRFLFVSRIVWSSLPPMLIWKRRSARLGSLVSSRVEPLWTSHAMSCGNKPSKICRFQKGGGCKLGWLEMSLKKFQFFQDWAMKIWDL